MGFPSHATIGSFALLASGIALVFFLLVAPTRAQPQSIKPFDDSGSAPEQPSDEVPQSVDASDDPRIVQEQPLNQVKRRIVDLIRADNYENFTGMAFDHDNQEVILYWKGVLPPALESLIRDPELEAKVHVEPRDYSQDELRREGTRIALLDLSQHGIIISRTASTSDFRGIKIGITSSKAIPAAEQLISSHMPLEFSVAGLAVPLGPLVLY